MSRSKNQEPTETVIIMNDCDNDKAIVYSDNKKVLNKLNKYIEQNPENSKLLESDIYGCKYLIPKDWIRIKPKGKYNISDEVKEERRKHMSNIRGKNDDV